MPDGILRRWAGAVDSIVPVAVDVLLPLPLQPLRYLVPHGRDPGPVGGRVAVPWQGGVRLGLAVDVEETSAAKGLELKEIIDWLDDSPYVMRRAVPALAELAAYAGVPQGVLLATLLPGGFREDLLYRVRAVAEGAAGTLPADRWVDARDLDPGELQLWREQGSIYERIEVVRPVTQVLAALRAEDEELQGAPRENQRTALAWLHEHGAAESGAALARAAEVPESAVRALVKKGYAAYRDVPVPPPLVPEVVPREGLPRSPGELPRAEAVLVSGGRRADRLAAFLPAFRSDLAEGRSPLAVFPEQRFLDEAAGLLAAHVPVVVVSGDMDDDVRAQVWNRVAEGAPALVLGTYLAMLAPRPEPGMAVSFEAGASTYKLPSGARLFVPDAVRRIARATSLRFGAADAIAGPEARGWVEADAHLALPLPRMRVHASDLGGASSWPVGAELAQVLRQVEVRDRQAVVLAPRRGFSGAFGCPSCGWIAGCPNCDLALRYHRKESRLRCHQCGHEAPPPGSCPDCGRAELEPVRGAGTEWIAQAIRRLVPALSVLRWDADHRDDLGGLLAGGPGIVVGTTALLRMAPLPRLSLIAVAHLDTHLALADFRAEEEALRMLVQLAELAGGAVPLTVVQTYRPEHPLLAALRAEDPDRAVAEYLEELRVRRERFGYPPAAHLAKFQLAARDRNAAFAAARAAVDRLRTGGATEDEVLGPAPAPVSRVRGQHAVQLFVRSPSEDRFRELLSATDAAARGVRVRVDVDPRDVGAFLE